MKKINKVKIGDKVFNIIYDTLSDNAISIYEPTVQGKIIPETDTIYVVDYVKSQSQTNNTILHEIIHGLDTFMNLNLSEDQVLSLTNGLKMCINDNRELFKQILNL